MRSCAGMHPLTVTGRNRCIVRRRQSAGLNRLLLDAAGVLRWGSSLVLLPGFQTRLYGYFPTAASLSTPERPTWVRGLERFSPSWRLMHSAHRCTKYRLSWGTLLLCLSTCKHQRADRQCLWATPSLAPARTFTSSCARWLSNFLDFPS